MSSTEERVKNNWNFGVVQSDRREGWNDPAIAQFKENRLQALTREIIQNSMDARRGDDDVVQVRFQERTMPRTDIPNLITLTEVLGKCLQDAKDEPSSIKREIQAVINYAKRDEIRVLSISDTGTKGMPGPCENGTPFYRYLKASGQSGGEENRAGSHGIGKMAPLASSNMRTILVSTTWEDEDGEQHELLQGRANLRSHVSDGKLYEGVGYWGKGFDPIEPKGCTHRWLRREKRDGAGTTIHILGWSPTEKEWADVILGYAAINFFAALERGKLDIRIERGDGAQEKKLNKENIREFFAIPKIRNEMKGVGHLKEFSNSEFFHKCITDDKGVEIIGPDSLDYFGQSTLRMRVEGGAPRKIAIIRNHMLITTYFNGFWKSGIPIKYKECGGVFECHEEGEDELRGNKLLRSMEPPAHNQLSSDIPPTDAQENAKNALAKLAQYLREKVGQFASYEVPPGSEVDVMRDFLGDEGEDAGVGGNEREFDPKGGFTIHSKPIKLSPLRRTEVGEEEEEVPSGGSKEENNADGGDRSGTKGEGDNTEEKVLQPAKQDAPLLKHRVIRTGENAVRVVITSAETQEAHLLIDEVGEDMRELFKIKDASGNMVEKLRISLKADEQVSLDLVLDREIVGGLILSAEKIIKEGEAK